MKLATTTGDFGGFTQSLAENVAFFEGTGFRYLDLSLYRMIYEGSPLLTDEWERWTAEGAEAAAARGFSFCQSHSPDGDMHQEGEGFDIFLHGTIRSLEVCAKLGIPHIVVHARDIGGYPSRENRRLNLERNRRFFEKLFPTMDKTGVRVLLENTCDNHAPTPQENRRHFPATAAELLELQEFLNHPLLGICWDTGHAHMQSLDQYDSIMELGSNLKALHVVDNRGDDDSHTAPYQGSVNFDSVMQGLLDSGYQGFFTFEAMNILHNSNSWPHYRKEWIYRGEKVEKLAIVPLELKRQAIALLYQIGRHILETYGCYEE